MTFRRRQPAVIAPDTPMPIDYFHIDALAVTQYLVSFNY